MTKTYPNWTYGMEIETWGEIKVNSSDDIIHIYDENGKKQLRVYGDIGSDKCRHFKLLRSLLLSVIQIDIKPISYCLIFWKTLSKVL